METPDKIETQAEHDRKVRALWRFGAIAGSLIFIVTSGIVFTLFFTGYDPDKVVTVSTSIFQIVVLSYGCMFIVPYFLITLSKINLGINMNRKALELGTETARGLTEMNKDVKPLIEKMQGMVDKMQPVVEKFDEDKIRAEGDQFIEKLKDAVNPKFTYYPAAEEDPLLEEVNTFEKEPDKVRT